MRKKILSLTLTFFKKYDIIYIENEKRNKHLLLSVGEREFIMTNREFFEAIVNGFYSVKAKDGEILTGSICTEDGKLIDAIKDFAVESIEKINKRNAKRASTETKTQKENKMVKDMIFTVMEYGEFYSAKSIAESIGVSVQKASALLRQMVTDGILVVEDGKTKRYGIKE